MFVTEKSYLELKNLDLEVRKMVAKVTNAIIDREGIVLYGTIYEDGTYTGFSTVQEKNDTHVLMAVGADEMGILEPIDKEVHKNKLSEDEKLTTEQRRIKDLEGELHQVRELQKRQMATPSGGHSV